MRLMLVAVIVGMIVGLLASIVFGEETTSIVGTAVVKVHLDDGSGVRFFDLRFGGENQTALVSVHERAPLAKWLVEQNGNRVVVVFEGREK